ncbi:hypothetical protein LEP1GSC052_3616 [Leptospira kmetyi serovar Malaysia str. Bejo-Iso9]|nr:hypothetical protein LEP1GSC052_3616 [Leptospira kmetyi serovar Malaysia str. Bejo-Iso9]
MATSTTAKPQVFKLVSTHPGIAKRRIGKHLSNSSMSLAQTCSLETRILQFQNPKLKTDAMRKARILFFIPLMRYSQFEKSIRKKRTIPVQKEIS